MKIKNFLTAIMIMTMMMSPAAFVSALTVGLDTTQGTSNSQIAASLLAEPSAVSPGGSATVYWKSEGASYCTLTTGSIDDYGAGAAPLSGEKSINKITADRTVIFTCNGPKGTIQKKLTITVNTCGNGKVDEGEKCDTARIVEPTNSCDAWGYFNTNGVVKCASDCKSIDFTNCAQELGEEVKCVFIGATSEQTCYIAADNNNLGCTGKETCTVDIEGLKGDKIIWKSTCGGYAYTTIDGQNEYANFKCTQQTQNNSSNNDLCVKKENCVYINGQVGKCDSCWNDGETLSVYSCTAEGVYAGDKSFVCKNGCKDGACIPDSNYVGLNMATDKQEYVAGDIIYLKLSHASSKSVVVDLYITTSDEQVTVSSAIPVDELTEYKIDTARYAKTFSNSGQYNLLVCNSGQKCIGGNTNAISIYFKTREKCFDSDDGKSYFIQGSVTVSPLNTKGIDTCQNSEVLGEYYCNSLSELTYEIYSCPNGCIDGACIAEAGESPAISSVSNNKDAYAPQEKVSLIVKAVEPDGTPAEFTEGYNVQFYIYNSAGERVESIVSNNQYNAEYNEGYWHVTFNAPDMEDKYYLDAILYCSRENMKCSDNYPQGIYNEWKEKIYFKVSSQTNEGTSDFSCKNLLIDECMQYPECIVQKDFFGFLRKCVNAGQGKDTQTKGKENFGTGTVPLLKSLVISHDAGSYGLSVMSSDKGGAPRINLITDDLNNDGNPEHSSDEYWSIFTYGSQYGSDNRGNLAFWGHPSEGKLNEVLVLKDTGYVGIGTSTPNQRLSVNGNIEANGKLIMKSDNGQSFACGPDNYGEWKCSPSDIGEDAKPESNQSKKDKSTQTTGEVPQAVVTCIDTDMDKAYPEGLNYYKQGTVNLTGRSFVKTDSCADSKALNEFSCPADGGVSVDRYICPSGCLNGACVQSTTTQATPTASQCNNECDGCTQDDGQPGQCSRYGSCEDVGYC